MGFERAFIQQPIEQATGSTVEWPNSSTISEATLLGTAPVLIAVDRPGLNRRKLIIENDGATPIIFNLGGTTTLSTSRRTGILNPGDSYIDDYPIWQGPVSAALTTAGTGTANITEAIVII